jgi:aspartyl-tRNA(Asn)/glutamyl-tRNA(Gln) amidotransferase subunit A
VIEQLLDEVEPYIEAAVRDTVARLEAAGANVAAVELERLRYANAIHHVIQQAEASQAHAPWFHAQYRNYSEPVRLRLEVGRLLPATEYLAAHQARRLLIDEAAQQMKGLDALLAPATPCVAPPQDSTEVNIRGVERELRSALLSCVVPPSELACPVVAVPVGSHEGLPLGMQIIGRPFAEPLLVSIAAVCEQRSRPQLAALD